MLHRNSRQRTFTPELETFRAKIRSAISVIRREQSFLDVYARDYNAEFPKPKQELKDATLRIFASVHISNCFSYE